MEKKLRYKLLSGTHRINGERFAKDDIFSEYPHKAEWMKHRLELIDKSPEVVDEEKREEVKLKKVHRGAGRYIVINELTEEPVHEGTLKAAEAEKLLLKMSNKSESGGILATDAGEVPDEAPEEDLEETNGEDDWDDDDN